MAIPCIGPSVRMERLKPLVWGRGFGRSLMKDIKGAYPPLGISTLSNSHPTVRLSPPISTGQFAGEGFDSVVVFSR
jgi:hypothetical protein